jgi:hypothetical protein
MSMDLRVQEQCAEAERLLGDGRIDQAVARITDAIDGGHWPRPLFLVSFMRRVGSVEALRPIAERIWRRRPNQLYETALAGAGFETPAWSAEEVRRWKVVDGHTYSKDIDDHFPVPSHPAAVPMAGRRTPDVILYEFRDVTLSVTDCGFAIFDRKGRPFRQSSLPILKGNIRWLRRGRKMGEFSEAFFNGSVVQGQHRNYCLWFTNELARMCWARRLAPQWPILLPYSDMKDFHHESLLDADLSSFVRTLDRGKYEIGTLRVLSNSCFGATVRLNGGNARFAQPLLDDFPASCASSGERIFVARSPGSRRTIQNYDEIERVMTRHGFSMLDPGTLPFTRQRQIFSSASHVIGLHGAGMTNILFCNSNTKVMEIFPPSHGTRAFTWIADVKRLNYETFFASADQSQQKSWVETVSEDFYIDPEDLAGRVSLFLRD